MYSAAVRLLQALALVAPVGDSKLARGLRARRGLLDSYADWGRRERDRKRPLVWVHAPSVGEALQAQPVVTLLRERQPATQIAYTFFSPSAEPFAATIPADFRAYLPFDHPRDCAAAIEALHPSALVFCKSDVWPNLVAVAGGAKLPLGLISGTVPADSFRLRPPAVTLMRSTFARLDRVGAVDAGDAERLARLGVARSRITVTGDTRFDQVWARATKPAPETVQRLRGERPTLVAGSTWPSDEEVLLPALIALRKSHPELRVILAPHEVTAARMSGLEQALSSAAGEVTRISSGNAAIADFVLVDGYGILGDLYRLASFAFVGGGFHRAGLHSVLEPAAFGAPVIFGPLHGSSRDPRLLIEAGGGHAVARRQEIETVLGEWIQDAAARDRAGDAARQLVAGGRGASERSYALVAELLELSGIARPR
ncbi:MAG TPA: glycosyltransferase N-terminal domain-containing protein [Gemmatimonadaceae bacterium]